MNKVSVILMLCLALFPLHITAQKEVRKAKKALAKKKYSEAERLISLAAHTPDEMTAEAWLVYGQVYGKMLENGLTKEGMSEDNMLTKTLFAFESMKSSPGYESFMGMTADVYEGSLFNHFYTQGNTYYKDEAFTKARIAYEKLIRMRPEDTIGYYMAAFSGLGSKEYQAVEPHLEKLLAMGKISPKMILNLLSIQQNFLGHDQKAYDNSVQGLSLYPNNIDILTVQLPLSVKLGKQEEAYQTLDYLIPRASSNKAILLYYKGTLLEEDNRQEEAIGAYQRAIMVDPEHYESLYSLGAIYFEKATRISKELIDLPEKDRETKEAQLSNAMVDSFRKAVPYLEKCVELKPKTRAVWGFLASAYDKLGMRTKYKHAMVQFKNN